MRFFRFLFVLSTIAFLMACANIGSPDGGPYDEDPPVFIGSSIPLGADQVSATRIRLHFNEYIQLKSAADQIVISPPQLNMPEISAAGRDITVKLIDSLLPNTTYTIDFGEAITDNNEGNPLGQFTYYFATGTQVDTLEVSGTVLDASNLEPIKGIYVGLHSNLNDTAFTHLPFERVGRTNGSGRFTIRGIAPGTYRIFALKDADGDFRFSQKSELIAVGSTISPSAAPAVRTDTAWVDSATIDSLRLVHYTRFMPDDIVLRAFTELNPQRYLKRYERPDAYHFQLVFTTPTDTLPHIEGLNFDATRLIVSTTPSHDSIIYWLPDTLMAQLDTLTFALTYYRSNDSTFALEHFTDTLTLRPKRTLTQQHAPFAKRVEEWQKRKTKAERKNEPFTEQQPHQWLDLALAARGGAPPTANPTLSSPTPLARIAHEGIHLVQFINDSTTQTIPFRIDTLSLHRLAIFAEWQPGERYRLTIDTAAIADIYDLENQGAEYNLSYGKEEDFGTLFTNIIGGDTSYVVQLLTGDNVTAEARCDARGVASFYYLSPAKYYMRLFIDTNANDQWDTGSYTTNKAPEQVYYYPQEFEVKARWDTEETWNPTAHSLTSQKPEAITKQKPDKRNEIKQRNAERAAQLRQ
ncbi:MAG: Ig-like domain-containing protein [Bacteroidales bacterium]|nr:Ig-like domain-containing protein [Bacteroidales bacterium]